MSLKLNEMADDIAKRWKAADVRRAKRGQSAADLTWEDLRDFGSLYADEADCWQLDKITDISFRKLTERGA